MLENEEGSVIYNGQDIYSSDIDVVELRKKVEWYSKNPILSLNPFMRI
jgi:ABC-type phosphate transport system ATPase subunit